MTQSLWLTTLMLAGIHLLLPLILSATHVLERQSSWGAWWIRSLAWFAFAAHLFLAGSWSWLGYSLRYAIPAIILLAILVSWSIHRRRSLPFTPSVNWKEALGIAIHAVLLLYFGFFAASALSGQFYSGETIELEFPLGNGTYYVGNGGNNRLINPHLPHRGQEYALDIVKLGPMGARTSRFVPRTLDEFHIFGEILLSPCDGIVLRVVDGYPDLPALVADRDNPAGNHVLLGLSTEDPENNDATYKVLLAHLQQNSILVAEGDVVQKGQPLGRVGNSGNTSEPHLHIHVERGGSPQGILDGAGIPMLFEENRFLVRNSLVSR